MQEPASASASASAPVSEPEPARWLGKQTACDICRTPFTEIPYFVDAALSRQRILRVLNTLNKNYFKISPFCEQLYKGLTAAIVPGRLVSWAILCPTCFSLLTPGKLGVGRGQAYDATTKVKLTALP